MFREGEIRVTLALHGGRIRDVRIASTRAPLPAGLVRQRPADDVARMVPLLYSICARAQAAAAAGALDAARGRSADAAALGARRADVVRETALELLTRLLLDWPRLLGTPAAVAAVARARQSTAAETLAVCTDIAGTHVYGAAPEDWLVAMRGEGLARWIEQSPTGPAACLRRLQREAPGLGASNIAALPVAGADEIGRMLPPLDDGDEFSRVPEWQGRPAETGPLPRRSADPIVAAYRQQHGNDAGARLLAQLVDLAGWLTQQEMVSSAVAQAEIAPGVGVGTAQTARGLLLHQVQVDGEKVTRYRVVAPTEWNFHPAGPLVHGLIGRPAPDADVARRQARWLVQALDPCVASDVEVADA